MLFYDPDPRLREQLVHSGRLIVRPPSDPVTTTKEAVFAAERVLAAYDLAVTEGQDHPEWRATGQWDRLIARSYGDLLRALEGRDPAALADTLERVFGSRVSTGLSMGGELGYLSEPSSRDFYLDWWIDGLLCLSSYLGLLPETMDTGQAAIPSEAVFEQLHRAVQERLGATVAFPAVCNAWGVEFDGVLTPRTAWRHLHSAHAMLAEVAGVESPQIVEVGGGFGGVAYWSHRLRPGAVRYTIYDFPIVNAIAGYFLLRALPDVPVALNGEASDAASAQVSILPTWRITDEPDRGADLAFNQDSLPEMPRDAALRYLSIFDRIVRLGFYSENQEDAHLWDGGDPSSAQLRLPELEDSMKRLRRTSRFRAWMRRGYFESFYRPD